MFSFLNKKKQKQQVNRSQAMPMQSTPQIEDLPPPPAPKQEAPEQRKPVLDNTPAQPKEFTPASPKETVFQKPPKKTGALENLKQKLTTKKSEPELNSPGIIPVAQPKDNPPLSSQSTQQPIHINATNNPSSERKYVQTEDPIDPRDRFDDLIPEEEPEEKLTPITVEPIQNQEVEEPEPIIPQSENTPEPPTHPDKPQEHDFALPSADTLKQKISGVAGSIVDKISGHEAPKEKVPEPAPEITPEENPWAQELQAQTQTIPEPAHEFHLPGEFIRDIPNAEKKLPTDMPPKLGFSLYVSINDLAYAKELTKKMHRFYATADKELEKWENPEKDKLLSQMFLNLDEAQELVIKVDEKLFEGGL